MHTIHLFNGSRALVLAAIVFLVLLGAMPALAQQQGGGQGQTDSTFDLTNPISILNQAGEALPLNGMTEELTGQTQQETGEQGAEQDVEQLEAEGGRLSATLSIILLLTVLSLAPAILVMCTSFTRIVVVLALLRQAMGTQQMPPSQVVVGLSLIMTFLVMAPALERVNTNALQPLQAGQITEIQAWEQAKQPLRQFMFDQLEYAGNWDELYMIMEYRGQDVSEPESLTRSDVDMLTLVPAFVLSELKIAFIMGFRLYLPFLIIDMIVASVLISMGMLMLPPVLISLPFKLLLFVLVDGWALVAGNLLNSFAGGGGG